MKVHVGPPRAPLDYGKAWLLALPLSAAFSGGAIRAAEGRQHVLAAGVACGAITAAILSVIKLLARLDD